MNTPYSDLSRRGRVGIIGGNAPAQLALSQAEELGRLLAEAGYILVNGGMQGVMEASARGARTGGGLVIAIVPGQSRTEANPYSDIVIPTGLGHLRNPLVAMNADILVAIDGSYGTLSEISYAKIQGKTVLGLNTWDIDGIISLDSPITVMAKIKEYFENK